MILRQISTKLKNTYEPSTGLFISRDKIGSGYNWYSDCSNSPLTASDPFGLRPPNDQDRGRLHKLRRSLSKSGFTEQEINEVTNSLKSEIKASKGKDAKGDPDNLRALWWAIDRLGDPSWGKGGSAATGPNTNKCNSFVYEAYLSGAGVTMPDRKRDRPGNQPFGADALADPERSFAELEDTRLLDPGDIVALGNPGGHVMMYVGKDTYIYASRFAVKVGRLDPNLGQGIGSDRKRLRLLKRRKEP